MRNKKQDKLIYYKIYFFFLVSEGFYDTDDKCDDLYGRLDHLLNISPDFYPGDDDMFSRFSGKSIGEGEAAYGNKGDTWISKFLQKLM